MSHPRASDTSPSDWKYINEGGSTIVLAYTGDAHPDFSEMVLRLRKAKLNVDTQAVDNQDEPDDPAVEFHRRVTSCLLPAEHLPHLAIVQVDPEWLQRLSDLVDSKRPSHRRTQDHIDFSKSKGVIATNLVSGSLLTVEIKPKWGFLPNPTFLSSETRIQKTKYCRYCMHTRMRADSSSGQQMNTYCPLDLFSRKEERIRLALEGLWHSWLQSNATINNLRIFLDGKALSNDDISLSRMSSALYQASQDTNDLDAGALLVERLVTLIGSTDLFDHLQRLQRTLDAFDIEGVMQLWAQHCASSDSHHQTLDAFEPTMHDWTTFIEAYLSHSHSTVEHLPTYDLQSLRHTLLSFLLSASFKDCSVMICLHQNPALSKLFVIDVDPKSLSRLERWYQLDRDIALSCSAYVKEPCIDGNSL